ncbi:DUF5681 domain-containing protein [Sphingosinicella rhizophila]|uniref:DUF5681 domain-containing protein n=1 Tax=Sphingosinicella rhizophila TaxID=3050082 RepID=A0ABU3Q4R1_9SPHN|nr:DUF5681 domain-containing protein [Sphingosinicella sp. GR2756]MDT9597925.1 DUF5681 domain-containing protein [Sphingosinicella sp. GR2756]
MSDPNEPQDDCPEKKGKGDYDVGYGRPPKHTRFKPGQCPNPKGRPKGAKSFRTDVLEILKLPVAVTENGKTKKGSTQRASLLRLREKALKGDIRALDRLLALAAEHNPENGSEAPTADLIAEDQKILANARKRQKGDAPPASDPDPHDEDEQ